MVSTLAYCGRWRRRLTLAARRALRLSPRDPFSAALLSVSPPTPSSSGATTRQAMRLAREGIRQRGDFVGAHRVLTAAAGMAGQADVAERRFAGASTRAAQHLPGLAWKSNAHPAGQRPGALSRRLSPCRVGIAFGLQGHGSGRAWVVRTAGRPDWAVVARRDQLVGRSAHEPGHAVLARNQQRCCSACTFIRLNSNTIQHGALR